MENYKKLLITAQQNVNKQPVTKPCYQRNITAPKKESKEATLSENIKKFIAQKKEEERHKALEEKKKKENLFTLRDQKTQNRIKKHLKVCKSANKSVMFDAFEHKSAAITLGGSQCDEDDFGYISQESSAFYDNYINKYHPSVPEKPQFEDNEKKIVSDLSSIRDRVKQVLQEQESKKTFAHKRKRESDSKPKENSQIEEKDRRRNKYEEKVEEPYSKKKCMPPPMDYKKLLELASLKQHEPIIFKEIKPKYIRPSCSNRYSAKPTNSSSSNGIKSTGKINKENTVPKSLSTFSKRHTDKFPEKSNNINSEKSNSFKLSKNDTTAEERRKLEEEKRKFEEMKQNFEEEKKKFLISKSKKDEKRSNSNTQKPTNSKTKQLNKSSSTISFKIPLKSNSLSSNSKSSSDLKTRQLSQADVRPRQFPSIDVKPRQFPPADVKKSKSKLKVQKRRIIDSDDEDYDSELEDFIDDRPADEGEDYSKYIREIFGYDKSKYADIDDEDDAAMESNYAQQQKEEVRSAKLGRMEDLEDMRQEALEKKRNALMKKKRQERI